MVTGVPLGIGPGVCRYKIVSVHGIWMLIVIVTRVQRDRHVGQRKASTCAERTWPSRAHVLVLTEVLAENTPGSGRVDRGSKWQA